MLRRTLRLAGIALAVAVLAGAAAWGAIVAPRTPSAQRAWAMDHARPARATFEGSLVHVRDVRDFRYTASDRYVPAWYDRTYSLDDLSSVWFIVTPFDDGFRGPAHVFVSFGFADSHYVAISVEGRRETHERYSIVAGALRAFELVYIVGDERDLIGRRALFDDDDVFVYPVRTSPERMRALFVEMLARANALQERPEFYHTLLSNCTTNLIDHVNHVVPGRIPPAISAILPGYSDDLARSLGLIEDEGSIDALRARYRVNDRARAAVEGGGDFSQLIRQR